MSCFGVPEPIPNFGEDLGYIAMVIRSRDRFRLIHAPHRVVQVVQQVIRELAGNDWYGACPSDEYGACTLRLPGWPFDPSKGKRNATLGKLLMVRIFEEVLRLGYDLIGSSSLAPTKDHSTLLFKKVRRPRRTAAAAAPGLGEERGLDLDFDLGSGDDGASRGSVMCVSPGSDFGVGLSSCDKLVAVCCPEDAFAAIQSAVGSPSGGGARFEVMADNTSKHLGEEVREIKMYGTPWRSSQDPSRRLVLEIVRRLHRTGWHLLGSVNLKGIYDSLFFVRTGAGWAPPPPLGAVSFRKSNSMRFIDFPDDVKLDLAKVLTCTLNKLYEPLGHRVELQDPAAEESGYPSALARNSLDFRLPGAPFCCGCSCGRCSGGSDGSSGMESVYARSAVCSVLSVLNARGFETVCSMRAGRDKADLSVLVMRGGCWPRSLRYACMSMTGEGTLRFIGFPSKDARILRKIARQAYAPGIAADSKDHDDDDDTTVDHDDHGVGPGYPVAFSEMSLAGRPWSERSASSCHGKSLLLLLLVKAEVLGWELMASAKVSSARCRCCRRKVLCSRLRHRLSGKQQPDVDSWFFRYTKETVEPDAPDAPASSDVSGGGASTLSSSSSSSSAVGYHEVCGASGQVGGLLHTCDPHHPYHQSRQVHHHHHLPHCQMGAGLVWDQSVPIFPHNNRSFDEAPLTTEV